MESTIRVWSKAYQRPVQREEAIEILMNVKRLAEMMQKANGGA